MLVRVINGSSAEGKELLLRDENGQDITAQQFVLKSGMMLDFVHAINRDKDDKFGITYDSCDNIFVMSEATYQWFQIRLEEIQAAIDNHGNIIDCMAC